MSLYQQETPGGTVIRRLTGDSGPDPIVTTVTSAELVEMAEEFRERKRLKTAASGRCRCGRPLNAFGGVADGETHCRACGGKPSGPSREFLASAADVEDSTRSVSVGGLAAGLGMLDPQAVRRRIVCLCGSTRFYHEYQLANYRETMAGRIVLTVGHYLHVPGQEHGESVGCTPEQKIELDRIHCEKIDLADEILVIDINGYAGESTRREIAYAKETGKRVRYVSEEWEPSEFWTADNVPVPPAAEPVR